MTHCKHHRDASTCPMCMLENLRQPRGLRSGQLLNTTPHIQTIPNKENRIRLVKEIIENTNGQVFFVEFIKRDGSLRRMTCHTIPVPTGDMSSEVPYDPDAYDIVQVKDIEVGQVRSFKYESVLRVAGKGFDLDIRKL